MVGECWAEGVVMNGGGGVWSARMAAQPVSPSIDIRRRPAYSLRGLRSCARYTGLAQPIGVPMPRPVVAAAIVDSLRDPTMLLACSRAYPQDLRGQFELPGGKVEDAEDPAEALAREIAEELGARLTIGERVCPEGGQWWPILGGRVMGVWLAEVAAGSPAPRAGASHLEARWVPLADLAALPWIVADLPIVEAVVARCAR